MNWKDAENYNRQFLDTLPIEQFMVANQHVDDLMDILQDKYGNSVEDDCILQGEVFNYLDREDFSDYLRKRYKARVCEWVTTTYEIVEWDKDYGTNK